MSYQALNLDSQIRCYDKFCAKILGKEVIPLSACAFVKVRHRCGKMTDIQYFNFDVCDSTNTRAKEYLKQNSCDTAVFTANQQTAGRGRQGKSFFSPKDCGVYMTFVKHIELDLCDTVFTTTFAACAVCRALEHLSGMPLKIKWVNDIYLNGKKICGILTESITDIETGKAKYVVIGVGVNLTAAFPDELADTAGNLGALDKDAVIREIVRELSVIGDCPHGRLYMEYYREHSLVIGRQITCFENGRAYSAFVVDVDDDGGLVVKTPQNEIKILRSGEISVRLC